MVMVDRLARKSELDDLVKAVDALSKRVDALDKRGNSSSYRFERLESRVEILENKLARELLGMSAKIPTCPKCGKQMPADNYTFCPFCGTALEK
jgi:rubrerythrin